jgi:Family of unknown function (DUF5719)
MRSIRTQTARGQALVAIGTVVGLVVTLAWFGRIGPKAPEPLPVGRTPSGAWLCPHGGASGTSVSVYLGNPGTAPVRARITRLGTEAPDAMEAVDVPAGSTLRIDSTPEARGASTYVEFFGGWLGAGWVLSTEDGVAAEPCAAAAARRWYLADATTQLGEEAFVVIANPFDAPAVLDAVLYTADRAPIRDSDWTDLVVPARRSIELHLNTKVEGEPVVAVTLDVTVGRVAAATLGVTDRTKLRSALGETELATGGLFPEMQGAGQTELVVLSTAERATRFGVTELSEEPPRPAGGLTEQEHGPAAARAYAIPVGEGPTALRLFTLEDARVAGALRARGPGDDLGSTGGVTVPATAWLLLPAVPRSGATPGAVLVNDGDADVAATVTMLPAGDGTAAAPVTVEVPAHSAVAVPSDLWSSAPDAALVVRADGGPIVALAASTSRVPGGGDGYALSMAVPLPQSP